MLNIGTLCVDRVERALWLAGVNVFCSARARDVGQTRVTRDGFRALPNELHAVVVFGIVAGSNRNAPADTKVRSGEVDLFCPAEAEILHRNALLSQSVNQRRLDRLAGQTDIVPHYNAARLDHLCVGAANAARDVVVELIRYAPADVIGLKAIE